MHGKNLCTSCHKGITEIPHSEKLAPVECAACHRLESEVYSNSDHGKAVKAGASAASCLSCHGSSHELLSARSPESPVYRLNVPKTCAICHEDEPKMAKYRLLEKHAFRSYSQTVHGKALAGGHLQAAICTDCHGSHDLHSPVNPESKIYRANVPTTCGKCHENVLQAYQRSVHGKAALAGKREAPVCTDCHGEHTIKSHLDPSSSVYTTVVSEKTCGHCHGAEKIVSKYHLPPDRVKTYLESYHGLASKSGITTVANCASCHGAHGILPSSDPNSSVNKKNLPQTCGRCHPSVGEQLAKGFVHTSPSGDRDRIVYWVALFYRILIVLVVGGMSLFVLLDYCRKLRAHYRKSRLAQGTLRFTANERIQHLVLFLSFTVLAYTGFALKFPEAWWAYPFSLGGKGVDWRGIVHRAAALVFVMLGLYHAGYMAFTPRGRAQWKAMGLKKIPAKPGETTPYGFVEKMEYWALIWGSLVMAATGAMLTFENLAMKHFPKWAMDVATTVHYYEAILATLAILVWHFYFTMWDPEQYPMNLSMVTGKEKKP